MLIVTKDNFDQLKSSSKPLVIDAYATWCGPCMYMKPIFELIARDHGDTYDFAELNVDEAREIAIQLGISSVPTFLFMQNGQLKGKVTGALSQEEFVRKLQEVFAA